MSFIAGIKERAKAANKKIVLPESYEARNLAAAAKILEEGIAQVVLIGEEAKLREAAAGQDISKAIVIDPASYDKMPQLAQNLYEMRKAKGMTLEDAEKLLREDPLYLGVMLVKEDIVDGMVAGAINATGDVLRPALQILKTTPGVSLVSSFFIMVVPNCELGDDGVFVFSDCGLVQNPSAEELAAIAVSSAASFEQIMGTQARVAMLSHSTKGSAKHPDVDKVTQATEIAKKANPALMLDGELQLDAAIVPSIGASKAKGSDVAGRANVVIFPDLDSGNIGYKLVERLAKAEAFGPVTQGIAKPVNDLSRGCSAEDIVGVVAITALQAAAK
ncbi:MAG: phosphate acetyltransferase [Defluviitaleaceae bacterium]|nr:phosphate acetyltransferase [Defluviitaleaceae bacterium]